MLFVCYPKCSTCQKAKKWLEENKIEFEERHIKEDNPTLEELKEWHRRSGLPLKRFFNTRASRDRRTSGEAPDPGLRRSRAGRIQGS